jgi:cysteine-rich repeat protein
MRSYAMFACSWLTLTAGCFSPTSYDPPPGTTTADTPAGSTGSPTISTAETSALPATEDFPTTTSNSTSEATAAVTSTGDQCGDGVLDDGEECDDKGTADGDGCSHVCLKEFRRVFVTSQNFSGDLDGIEGADSKCQVAASNAGIPGVFRAWLSSSESSPAQNFVKSTVPYRDVMDEVIVDDWEGLVAVGDGSNLEASIYRTEFGEVATSGLHPCFPSDVVLVWSNTTGSGSMLSADRSCTTWTGVGEGGVGRLASKDETWTQYCPVPCATLAPLYCFEQ